MKFKYKMKGFVFSLIGLLYLIVSCNTLRKKNNHKYSAKILLRLNDSFINLNNNFKVHVERDNQSLNTSVVNDSVFFEIPVYLKYENFKIIFQKDSVIVAVNNVSGYMFTDESQEDWIFGIATTPYFNQIGLVISKDSVTYNHIRSINYLRLDPLGNGIGKIYKSYIR